MGSDGRRDYAADMRAVIDAETSGAPYISRVIAAQIVDKLTVNDPDLLDGWLHGQAETLIWQAINDRDRSTRSHARTAASRSVFARAAEAHAAGDSVPLCGFLDVPYVVEDGSRRRLADLNAHDLTFVADGYAAAARSSTLNAAFLRALARKVGDGRVADHFDDEHLAALWCSISGGNSQPPTPVP